MTSQLSNATAAAALNAVVDRLDAGSGAGKVAIYTADYATLLVTFTLSDPAGGDATTASPSVWTAADLPKSATAVATGTAGAFRAMDSDDTVHWSGTGSGAVGTSAAIVILTNLSITSGQTVNLTGFTKRLPTAITAAA